MMQARGDFRMKSGLLEPYTVTICTDYRPRTLKKAAGVVPAPALEAARSSPPTLIGT